MHFGALNYLILGIYLAGMVGVGLWFSRRQDSGEAFFMGDRKLPWVAVAMSMYASLTSAVTYLGLPGTAYRENIALIIVCIMSPLVAPLILMLFYPLYHRLKVTTSYEYIAKRFGAFGHYGTAGLFVLARLGWLGTVIYAPSMALSVATGIPLTTCILLMGVLATLYTTLGGLSAVVWTDVVQFVILVAGAIWIGISVITGTHGGVEQIMHVAGIAGKLHVADWNLSLFAMSGPIVAISFFLQLMQDYGTDQVTVQRLVAIGNLRGTVKAVVFNACTDFFIIALLLFIGLGLFAFYQGVELPEEISGDKVLPYYIITQLPNGVSGLMITAIFAAAMSSMDSGINSIATVVVNDFVHSKKHAVSLARMLTVVLGVFATALAFYVSSIGSIIEAFASFMSLFSAPVLALFLLGILTRRGNFLGWLVGLTLSLPATFWLQAVVGAHWVYFFPFSFTVAFVGSLLASRLFKSEPAPVDLTVYRFFNSTRS